MNSLSRVKLMNTPSDTQTRALGIPKFPILIVPISLEISQTHDLIIRN